MLQKAPMYSYIPAKDVSRARRFYEDTHRPELTTLAEAGFLACQNA